MQTLQLISELLDSGLSNHEIAVHYKGEKHYKCGDFKSVYGAISSIGAHQITDQIPEGVIVWGRENWIGMPSTMFKTSTNEEFGFYTYNE